MTNLNATQLRAVMGCVRDACLRAAVEAYEDAGLQGLCAEGRWECARRAIEALDVEAVTGEQPPPSGRALR